MAQNKYDFIRELLENKKINLKQRERILELAAMEIRNEGTLEERIQEIENIIFKDRSALRSNENQEPTKSQKPKQYKYISPYRLYQFLFEYNQNVVLRSTCHDIDSDGIATINEYCKTEHYDFQEHLKRIKEAYENHESKYFAPPKLKALIRGYLTGKDYQGNELKMGWSTDKIKISWSCPGVLAWTKKNPHFPPNINEEILGIKEVLGFEFEQINSNITGKTIQNFTQLVGHFKHLFHIRHDNSLRDILENKNQNENWNEIIDFDITDRYFPRNIEHFTDVDKLIQAYKKIIELIIKQRNDDSKPLVKLMFSESKKCVQLSIHHLNSVYNKSEQNTIERMGQFYSNLVIKQLNGLCNLYLKADFGNDKYAEINLWDGKDQKSKKIDHFKGVEHIFEFPKK